MYERGLALAVASSPGAALESFGDEQRVPTFAVGMQRQISPAADLVALWQLVRLFRSTRPTIVHAHTPKAGLLGMIAAAVARVPVRVYTMHGLPYVTASGWRRSLLRWTEKTACVLASSVIAVSHSVRGLALSDGICCAAKIQILANGSANGIDAEGELNPAAFRPGDRDTIRREHGIPSDAVVLTFVGRLARDKGITELCEAWELLRERFSRLRLVVIGDADERDPADPRMVAMLQRDERAFVLGALSHNLVTRLYSVTDLLVLPTYREGFPTVLLEASAMAVPIVATKATGCIDAVVDGETGALVPLRDSTALAEAISRYVEDAVLRATHGAAGRARVLRQYRPEQVWEAIYEEYKRLMREKNLPVPASQLL